MVGDRAGEGTRGEEATAPLAGESDTFVDVRAKEDEIPTPGETLARYVVLEEVGRGGMGRVLRAYDPKLQREVALKEVFGPRLDERARARLVVEARAMAKLSHANVVSVFDVEDVDGRLVMVMEFVAGQTLRQWLDATERSVADIVACFVRAGRGLAAAHRADVLHRDFKPANVLVAHDGTVKVTDFGIAKATFTPVSTASESGVDDVAGSELTRAGTVVGTPRYMAPEQHTGDTLGPAVDQYAFCVALWEALCGTPPFSGTQMVQAKRRGPPTWPREDVPRRLVEVLVRGLQPQPTRRWPQMSSLLSALEIAMAPRRRGRRLALGLATVGVAVVGAYALRESSPAPCTGAREHLQGVWDEATRQRVASSMRAVPGSFVGDVWERTSRTLDGYADGWVDMHTHACEATAVRGEQSSEVLDLRMGCLHDAKVSLQAAVEQLVEADAGVVENAHRIVDALPGLASCADIETLQTGIALAPPAERDRVDEISALLTRSRAARDAGRLEPAADLLAQAQEIAADVGYRPIQTRLAISEAYLLERQGEYEACDAMFRRAQRLAAQEQQWALLANATGHRMAGLARSLRRADDALELRELALGLAQSWPSELATVHSATAGAWLVKGVPDRAVPEARRSLELMTEGRGVRHVDVAGAQTNLAAALVDAGRYDEAERYNREAYEAMRERLGPEHPDTALASSNLAHVLSSLGRNEEAEARYRTTLKVWLRTLGREHPNVVGARNNLAVILASQGKHPEAESELRSLLTDLLLADAAPEMVASTRNNLAAVYSGQLDYERAEAEMRAALAATIEARGPDDPAVTASRANIGSLLFGLGKYGPAREMLTTVLETQTKALGPDHPDVAKTRATLGRALSKLGRHEEAISQQRAAVAALAGVLPDDSPSLGHERVRLAMTLLEGGEPAQALEAVEAGLVGLARDDVAAALRVEASFVRARARWESAAGRQERDDAIATARAALEQARAGGKPLAGFRDDLEAWLKEHAP